MVAATVLKTRTEQPPGERRGQREPSPIEPAKPHVLRAHESTGSSRAGFIFVESFLWGWVIVAIG